MLMNSIKHTQVALHKENSRIWEHMQKICTKFTKIQKKQKIFYFTDVSTQIERSDDLYYITRRADSLKYLSFAQGAKKAEEIAEN